MNSLQVPGFLLLFLLPLCVHLHSAKGAPVNVNNLEGASVSTNKPDCEDDSINTNNPKEAPVNLSSADGTPDNTNRIETSSVLSNSQNVGHSSQNVGPSSSTPSTLCTDMNVEARLPELCEELIRRIIELCADEEDQTPVRIRSR